MWMTTEGDLPTDGGYLDGGMIESDSKQPSQVGKISRRKQIIDDEDDLNG